MCPRRYNNFELNYAYDSKPPILYYMYFIKYTIIAWHCWIIIILYIAVAIYKYNRYLYAVVVLPIYIPTYILYLPLIYCTAISRE